MDNTCLGWIKTLPRDEPSKPKGLFGIQHSAARLWGRI